MHFGRYFISLLRSTCLCSGLLCKSSVLRCLGKPAALEARGDFRALRARASIIALPFPLQRVTPRGVRGL